MNRRLHTYRLNLQWTGRDDSPSFRNHVRSYVLTMPGKPPIAGSSDPVFRGDAARWTPEDLLVASLCACHHLWYMGLCAAAGISVIAYEDMAEGVMVEETAGGPGQFEKVVLRPRVVLVPGADLQKARDLHDVAHAKCFIARSVNFPVTHDADVRVGS